MKVPFKLKSSLVATALAAAFALPTYAQTAGTQQGTGAQATGAQTQQQRQQADTLNVRASTLIGMNVRNRTGENLGNVNDLVIDTQNNRVHYVVLSHGGFFGIGDNLFAFPLQSFALSADLNHLLLDVDRTALQQAEGFDRSRWPDMVHDGYWRGVDQRYGAGRGIIGQDRVTTTAGHPTAGATTTATGRTGTVDPAARTDARGTYGAGTGAATTAATQPGMRTTAPGTAPRADTQVTRQQLALERASDMMRANVLGAAGQRIGSVDDVIVDLNTGRVEFAVLAFDRGWLTQDRLIAMPLDQFQRTGRFEWQLPHTREQLAQAPGFQANAWPDLNDPAFRTRMQRYGTAQQPATSFGTPPAAPAGATATGETARQTMAGTGGTTGQQQGITGQQQLGTQAQVTTPATGGTAATSQHDAQAQRSGVQTQAGPQYRADAPTGTGTGVTGMQSQPGADVQIPAARSQAGTDYRATTTTGTTAGTPAHAGQQDRAAQTTTGATQQYGAGAQQQGTMTGQPMMGHPQARTFDGSTFDRLDVNRDGRISREEARADADFYGAFDRMDHRGAGSITRDDFDTYNQRSAHGGAGMQPGTTGMQQQSGTTGMQQQPGTTGMQQQRASGAPSTATSPHAGTAGERAFPDGTFDRLDANRDGRISRDEARADSQFNERFDQIDQTRTGYITREQFQAYQNRAAGIGGTQGTTGTTGTGTGTSQPAR